MTEREYEDLIASIGEQVHEAIASAVQPISERLGRIEVRLDGIESEMRGIQDSLRTIRTTMADMRSTLDGQAADIRNIYRRLPSERMIAAGE